MTGLQVELILAFLLNEPQIRPQRCFGDCLGIVVVVLLTLHEGFDVGRRDDPRLVAKTVECPTDKIRAQTGFYASDAGRQLIEA